MRPGRSAVLAYLAIALVALGSCAEEGKRPAVTPAATVVGEPQSCIPLFQLRETRIRDDWTIDFIADSGRIWRNALTSRCSGLKVSSGISYETSIGQLCSTDIIYLLEPGGHLRRGPACGLGEFVPVKLEK